MRSGSLPPLDTLRPLAFNETGRQYLKQLRQQEVRIASRFAAVPEPYRRLEYRSTQLYASMMGGIRPDRIVKKKKSADRSSCKIRIMTSSSLNYHKKSWQQ